jgi:hypothetical protein
MEASASWIEGQACTAPLEMPDDHDPSKDYTFHPTILLTYSSVGDTGEDVWVLEIEVVLWRIEVACLQAEKFEVSSNLSPL